MTLARKKRLSKIPHDVYRIRDEAGALLYVGCSVNVFKRIQQHKAEYQPWFPLAATVDIDQYPDLVTARYKEAHAIATEWPIWNTAREASALRRRDQITDTVIDTLTGVPIRDFWSAA